MRLYYILWVDCITNIRAKEEKNWKIKSMTAMSFAMMFNLFFIMAILQRNVIGYYFYKINLYFLPKIISNLVNVTALFILPCLVINYLLIFRNKRYEKLLTKYPYKKGKFIVTYLLCSTGIPIILLWISIIWSHNYFHF